MGTQRKGARLAIAAPLIALGAALALTSYRPVNDSKVMASTALAWQHADVGDIPPPG